MPLCPANLPDDLVALYATLQRIPDPDRVWRDKLPAARDCIRLIDALLKRGQPCRPEVAQDMARRLVACFTNAKGVDANLYALTVTKIFASYPEWMGRRIIDPVDGFAGTQRVLPSAGQINQAFNDLKLHEDETIRRARCVVTEHRKAADAAEMRRRDAEIEAAKTPEAMAKVSEMVAEFKRSVAENTVADGRRVGPRSYPWPDHIDIDKFPLAPRKDWRR